MSELLNKYRIRPSARLIKTIGKDLVKDKFAAVVELVKNAFDADSPSANVSFEYSKKNLAISVSDRGDGMDLDTVINKWLVPATSDKLDRKTTKRGRPLQGRKGIGRFAAAALGNLIHLETRAKGMNRVALLLDLDDFSNDRLLEEVPIVIEEGTNSGPIGTRLEIVTENISVDEVGMLWGEKQRTDLVVELSKLLAPAEVEMAGKSLGYLGSDDKFSISITYKNIPGVEDLTKSVEPFNIIDLYDYRIHGTIDENGDAAFQYVNQNLSGLRPEKFKRKLALEDPRSRAFPGKISFDLRVFDRDPESIEELINRGLKHPFSGEKVGKIKARQILNEYYGVSLFRGKFRIRPYGSKDFDWLELDKKRIQNPSMKIGHNQVIGFVNIQSEELSHLEEKSARDGLVEDAYYRELKHLVNSCMSHLEARRYQFRAKTFRGRRHTAQLDEKIEDLFNFEKVTARVSKKIGQLSIGQNTQNSIVSIVEKEIDREQKNKSTGYKKVRETIALYQGQATLGKITHILLHEGRKHIKVINEVPPRLIKWVRQLTKKYDESIYIKTSDRSDLLVNSSKALSILFKRIEPLAVSRRPNRKQLGLKKELISSFEIFESDLLKSDIKVELDIPDSLTISANTFDLVTIFVNLIENSLYWLSVSSTEEQVISAEAVEEKTTIELIFSDNGSGFQGTNLDLMFEPGFSMKPGGTGLGLALAGEAIERLGGNVRAVNSEQGACFVLTFKKESDVRN